MTIGDLTTGVQSTTATGAITPTTGLDISGITGDYTVKFRIVSLTAAKKCRIQLEDSVNGFTAAIPVEVINVKGEIGGTAKADSNYSFRKYQKPSMRAGTASAVARLNVTEIDSATTLEVKAWIEY